ncbi:MAG: lytic transglycosylase [Flavobacteriales bacterium]|nr:lytic transglycosylase [Flavobacteriales bacterium]|tara:strand:+ start:1983 stop:3185 length:1203 start_codon:yes stop_codon:yes gene_type:complete
MRKVFIFFIFIFINSSAQSNLNTVLFKNDTLLFYDTILKPKNKVISQNIIKTDYNSLIVKRRLDSLNDLTPLNLVFNKVVEQHIKFYLFQRQEQVSKLLALSDYYFPVFEMYLDKNQLPLELKYLPVIESSLNANARSHAGAVGLWQFMYPTAKEQGLRINTYLDERKDLYKSTQAACAYLLKAYNVFNNWDLALSSYNAGRGNVTKAIRRSGGKFNYWELRPFLPKETANYIPSFIAAVYVMNFANEHGILADENYKFKSYSIDSIHLNKSVKISHLAQLLNIETNLLKALNPTYRINLIPSLEGEKFPIILPDNKAGFFIVNEDSLYVELEKMELAEKLNYPAFTDVEKIRYKVKKGDFLGKIANKYKCTIKDLMLWNDLKNHNIRVGQRLNIYRTVK